ncbi:MAG: YeeE/YedE family protein, partial [Trueperaceae bacterium]
MAASGSQESVRPLAASIGFGARYLAIGAYFGFVLVKAEVLSWYRIQEMFRFHSFHMYGV